MSLSQVTDADTRSAAFLAASVSDALPLVVSQFNLYLYLLRRDCAESAFWSLIKSAGC